MATIEYKGAEFEYDEHALEKWSFIRRMYKAGSDAERAIVAAENLLVDPDDAADRLDDSVEAMAGLISAIFAKMGDSEKN